MTAENAPTRLTDGELVRRARDGDASAFCGLVDRHNASLLALAASLIGSVADAEDVVQETFAGAFRSLRAFQGRASVKTWLTAILFRQTALFRRRAARRATTMVPWETDSASHDGFSSATGAADARLDVASAIRSLCPEHRDVVVLRELKGLSYNEIAQALGIPRGTVESRLFRARRQLQKHLSEYLA